MRALIVMALGLGLAGCAAGDPGSRTILTEPADCAALFQVYDLIEVNNMQTRRDVTVPLPLQIQGGRLWRAGCITMTDELRLDEAAPVAVDEGGAPVGRVELHAGVVTTMADDAAARAFFEARGVPARSVGAAGLGRRIYLGPFTTEEGLGSAAALARSAGFDAPYPRRF